MNAKFLPIPTGYKVRAMTPREMVRMSHELFEAGLISFKDHLRLSSQPGLAPGAQDAPRDLIAQWEALLEAAAHGDGKGPSAQDRQLLALLRSLEAAADGACG